MEKFFAHVIMTQFTYENAFRMECLYCPRTKSIRINCKTVHAINDIKVSLAQKNVKGVNRQRKKRCL